MCKVMWLALVGTNSQILPGGFWVTRPYVFKDFSAGLTSSLQDFAKKTKNGHFKKRGPKKMLDGGGYVFPSGGVLSTILLTDLGCRDTKISNMISW